MSTEEQNKTPSSHWKDNGEIDRELIELLLKSV